jgi:hypothetical protein
MEMEKLEVYKYASSDAEEQRNEVAALMTLSDRELGMLPLHFFTFTLMCISLFIC